MAARQNRLVWGKRRFFDFNWLPRQRPLRNQKRGPDRSSTNRLSFSAKNAKIGPADPEIVCLRTIIKKRNYRKQNIYPDRQVCRAGKITG